MLYGHLRMRMPEAISRPSNLRIDSKLSLEEVMPNGVLINDIIDIANRLIILHPTSIRHLQLPLFKQFFDLFLLILVEIVVPILEEYDLRNKVFSGCVLAQCLKHRVEYSFRVPLIHSVQKSSGSEVNILEIIVSIKPEGIEMRVEGDQELLTILRAFLADSQSKQGQQQHYLKLILKHLQKEYQRAYDLLTLPHHQLIKLLPSLIILITMEDNARDESPRIAKITTSAQQFRDLINSLRNNHARRAGGAEAKPENAEEKGKGKEQRGDMQERKQRDHVAFSSTIFEENEELEEGLKAVPKKQVGGRDQLKKIKAAFDTRQQQTPTHSRVAQSKKQASVPLAQHQSKDINFSFESPKKNASTQCEFEPFAFQTPIQSSFMMHSSKLNQKAGQIVRQHIKNQVFPQPQEKSGRKIRDIAEKVVIDYCKKERIVQRADPSEIFSFFTNLCMSCDIIIRSPSIKKFKNCIYYGYPIIKDQTYQGFLYFYDSRLYYGEFLNGLKHGLGVQLNLNQQTKFKGEFSDGRKTGKFFVQKPGQKYIGYLQNGLYQGQGRLTTPDYIYQGVFQQGEKNGYGQEFYPKTGVKISGMFKNGILAKTRTSRSISDMKNKSKVGLTKEKERDRLEFVRKKSLEKHNSRMNKVRSFRDSEYEIEFDTQAEYNQLPKIHFNANKLDVYRQPIHKLPKITHELDYSFQGSHNFESLSSHGPSHPNPQKPPRQKRASAQPPNPQRMQQSEVQQPLPTPCLSFSIRKR